MDKLISRAPQAARLLLGVIFTVFGLNGFFNFLPMPPPPPAAGAFFGSLAATGYMLPLLKGFEVFAGVLLLSGRMVPFALTLLAPIVVNIVAFHLFLAPQGLPLAIVVLGLGSYLALVNRAAYSALFAAPRSTAGAAPTQTLTARPERQTLRAA
jgi:uncharacterized membrane protein YphA (DoxX/SURF4 family)